MRDYDAEIAKLREKIEDIEKEKMGEDCIRFGVKDAIYGCDSIMWTYSNFNDWFFVEHLKKNPLNVEVAVADVMSGDSYIASMHIKIGELLMLRDFINRLEKKVMEIIEDE